MENRTHAPSKVPVKRAGGNTTSDLKSENLALRRELNAAYQQQAATADVLKVMSGSSFDLAAVLDTLVASAARLCEADMASILRPKGEIFEYAASYGYSPEFVRFMETHPIRAGRGTAVGRTLLEGAPVHIPDIEADPEYTFREAQQSGHFRTILGVPLLRETIPIGVIVLMRRRMGPFNDNLIKLATTFAAQAVIAMENARLISDTREALEQQTATAEVLQVINSSPGNVAPVFDALLEKALRLCEAGLGQLWTHDGHSFEMAALRGVPGPWPEFLPSQQRLSPEAPLERLAAGQDLVHLLGVTAEDLYRSGDPHRKKTVELGGACSLLGVALRQDGKLLGALTIYRREVRSFSDKQIALLQNFAAQAVIAMENARLITELRQRTRDLQESLEYQTATSDVLKVISHSGAELEPVLDTLLKTAVRICGAQSGFIFGLDDGLFRMVASFGIPAEYEDFLARNPIALGRGTLIGRTASERRTVHIEDATADPEYTQIEAVQLGHRRTILGVPLVREDAVIGVITLARSRVESFAEKQIALVATFADQAVIAIENARLFGELRTRTTELGRSVEELMLLSEVGQAVSSTLDLRSVLSTILTRSVEMTGADAGAVFRYGLTDRSFRLVEAFGWDEALLGSIGELR
ncbi:MAG: GAF domain-containing protein, partial [Alphaproteobacteria bacterium]|nr:GAF domain-containing protein [Alphaproteobacteria bacterium]